jgi:UPF0716 protein FxsA
MKGLGVRMAQRKIIFVLFSLAALPLLEIGLMLRIGQSIGFVATVALLVTSAVVGLFVIRAVGLPRAVAMLRERGATAVSPAESVIDYSVIFFGGLLLMIPGFVSDAIGLTLLLPPVRKWIINRSLSQAFGPGMARPQQPGFRTQRRSSTGASEPRAKTYADLKSGPVRGDRIEDAFPGVIIEGEYERVEPDGRDARAAP